MKKHTKCSKNVVVNGLAMDIYEMKKKFEVHFLKHSSTYMYTLRDSVLVTIFPPTHPISLSVYDGGYWLLLEYITLLPCSKYIQYFEVLYE